MNTIAKAVLVSAVMSLPVFSGSAYSHSDSDSQGGMMGGMKMAPQEMMNMRKGMNENQALMEQIRAEEDADKRENLMQQHMERMHEQMRMMDKMMVDEDQDGMSPDSMPGQMQPMEMMNMRMDMMQMMMRQMMDHQDQDQDKHHDGPG